MSKELRGDGDGENWRKGHLKVKTCDVTVQCIGFGHLSTLFKDMYRGNKCVCTCKIFVSLEWMQRNINIVKMNVNEYFDRHKSINVICICWESDCNISVFWANKCILTR